MDYSNKSDALIKDVLQLHLPISDYNRYLQYIAEVVSTPGETPTEQIAAWIAEQEPETIADYANLIFRVDVIMEKYLMVTAGFEKRKSNGTTR